MGWFEEQVKLRQERDEERLYDSCLKIASSVMGRHTGSMLFHEHIQAKDVVDEVLAVYGHKAADIPDGIKGLDSQLEYALRPLGIMRRRIRLEAGWHKNAMGVMVAFMSGDGSPVCLIPGKLSGYAFRNPATGRREKVTDGNEGSFDREAYVFYRPFPLKKLTVAEVAGYVLSSFSARDIFWYIGLLIMTALIGMLMPALSKNLFSDVMPSGSFRALIAVALFMVCVAGSTLFLKASSALVSVRISRKISMFVEGAAMMRILSLPADFFKKFSAGELANRLGYMNQICRTVITQVLGTGISSLFALLYLIQVLVYAPELTVPAFCVTFSIILVTAVSLLWQSRIHMERMELSSKVSGMGYALISGIQKVKLSGAEKRAFARWGELYAKEAFRTYSIPTFLKVVPVINNGLTILGSIWLYFRAMESGIAVPDFYAFTVAYGIVSGALQMLSAFVPQAAEIAPAFEMIRPILEAEPETVGRRQVLTRLSGGIELNNVTFRYSEGMPNVIDNMTLKIRPGQYVAIVGATGCGKSTLMRLMLGFEEPCRGAVYYDGRNLANIDLKSLRQNIGVVMQDGKLFQGDIYSNIVISAPQLSLDEAWEVAEMVGIADDIRAMPMGMFTMISEGQGGISGGQRQRLMIARAIAQKPKILMFDEATSALDNLTQKKVTESLDSLKCTRIVIAHRLSTIRTCDRIIVLDKGKIVEDGNYDELISQNGQFSALVERQRLDDADYVGKTTIF